MDIDKNQVDIGQLAPICHKQKATLKPVPFAESNHSPRIYVFCFSHRKDIRSTNG